MCNCGGTMVWTHDSEDASRFQCEECGRVIWEFADGREEEQA